MVSERHWDCESEPRMFRARNRLTAVLAAATLVVEAGLPSGTIVTAEDAWGAGREVFAVPGPITAASSSGSNQLICKGATPVTGKQRFDELLDRCFGA